LEIVGRVEILVAEKIKHIAVKRVAARLGGEVDDAAVEPPELGGRTVALDLEFLNRIDHRVVRHLSRLRLQHRDAIEEILVGSRSSAVDARQHGIGRQGDARNDGREHDEQAPVQRQLHHVLVLDDRSEARRLCTHNRRVADDGHLFL
jgi:hypothetical protein